MAANKGGRPKGLPKTGGRRKGTPNKATASIRDAARGYTERALLTLADVMVDEQQPAAARVSAANALLDRGYGKPAQPVDGDGEGGAIKTVNEIILRGVKAGGDG